MTIFVQDRRYGAVRMLKASMLAGCISLASVPAWGQSAPAATPVGNSGANEPGDPSMPNQGGEEIVVTALKRSTRLQDTPVAITAATGEGLAQAGINDFTQLVRAAPSLTIVDAGAGARRVLIRGIQAAGEPTVGVYFDEVPVAGSVSTANDAAARTPDLRLFDVAQVEVLRGPQGTLFGSGSMGGTLRIIYNKPVDELEAAVDVQTRFTKGGGPGVDLNGMVNVPLVADKLAVRLVGYYTEQDGYVDNIRYGQKDLNDSTNYGGRIMLRFRPTDRLTLDGAAYLQNTKAYNPRWYADLGPYKTDARSESFNRDKLRIYNFTGTYDFDNVAVTAVSSYFDREYMQATDVSENFTTRGTATACRTYLTRTRACTDAELTNYLAYTSTLYASSLYIPQNLSAWTNELRVSSSGSGPLQWTAGVFSESRKTTVISQLRLANPSTGVLYDDPARIEYQRTIGDKLEQKAAFGEVSYDFTRQLTLTAGARYFKYDKRVSGRYDVPQYHYSTPAVPTQDVFNEASEDGWIFKFNASYRFTPTIMGYAQASQGFRPGGVNQVIAQLPPEFAGFGSDSLWNYELGLKSTLMGWLTINVAGYRIDWDDIQVTGRYPGESFSFISNAGKARIWGGEAELVAEPVDGLVLQGSFSYNDAKLSEDQVTAYVTGAGRKGDRLAFIPKVTASAGAEYSYPLSGAVNGLIRADLNYQGSSYSEINAANLYYRRVDDYTVVNMRVGVESDEGNWGAYLFVNNLFDTVAVNTVLAAASTNNRTTVYSMPPRTFGLSLRKKL